MGPVEKELIKFFETFDINSIPKEERIKQYNDKITKYKNENEIQ